MFECRTQGKADKLNYLKKTKMWYVNDRACSLEQLQPKKGAWPLREALQNTKITKAAKIQGLNHLVYNQSWLALAGLCCKRDANAP